MSENTIQEQVQEELQDIAQRISDALFAAHVNGAVRFVEKFKDYKLTEEDMEQFRAAILNGFLQHPIYVNMLQSMTGT